MNIRKVLTRDQYEIGSLQDSSYFEDSRVQATLGSKAERLEATANMHSLRSRFLCKYMETHTHFSTSTCCGKKKPK